MMMNGAKMSPPLNGHEHGRGDKLSDFDSAPAFETDVDASLGHGLGVTFRRNSASVSESIQKGRAALAEAEGHIKMFEEYLQSSAANLDHSYDDDVGMGMGMSMGNQQEEDFGETFTCTYSLSEHLLLDSVSNKLSSEGIPPPTSITTGSSETEMSSGSTKIIDQLMRDGEERIKRDEVIALARRNGNGNGNYGRTASSVLEMARYSHQSLLPENKKKHQHRPTSSSKSKGRLPFDPKNLLATRRAEVKVSKLIQAASAAEAEALEKSKFKARPLPNGAKVKNDPYALTKCARAKLNQNKESLNQGGNTSFMEGSTRLDASVLLGSTTSDPTSHSHSHLPSPSKSTCQSYNIENIASPQHSNKRKKLSLRTDIYNAATELVARTTTNDDFNDSLSTVDEAFSFDEQDVIDLHQQIAKLQAELKIKRLQCIETAEIFERETQCVSIQDLGISLPSTCNRDDSSKRGNENECCGGNEAGSIMSITTNAKEKRDVSCGKDTNSKRSLYDRQKSWLKRIEKRRQDAIEREEKHKVKDVTGRPDLVSAKKSWSKAKEEHDKLIKIAKERELILQSEREEKEKEQYLKKVKEAEIMQNLAKEKTKAMKKGIDRNLQAEYIDKLARPVHRVKVERPVKCRESIDVEKKDQTIQSKEQELLQGKEKKAKTASFADMDDKEFAKMIKKIETKARKGERKRVQSEKVQGEKQLLGEDDTMRADSGAMKESPYKSKR